MGMTDAPDDIILLKAFQQREALAEKTVFKRLFRPLCVFAEGITGHMDVAEDIVVEAMEKTWNRRGDFAAFLNLQRFLFHIVRNACIDHSRAEKRHQLAHTQLHYLSGGDVETDETLDNEILQAELLQEIYAEIERLPDRCGQIFKMIFIQGLSTDQIAAQLSLNVQTVRSQKARAIQLLKTQLLKRNRMALLLLYALLEKL
jgi:RNA polymerase sigma-70 factor (family 1)